MLLLISKFVKFNFWHLIIPRIFCNGYRGTTPINHSGLGQDRPSELDRNDNEYDMYRKRMMLAYRFRPNPLVCIFIFDKMLKLSFFLVE